MERKNNNKEQMTMPKTEAQKRARDKWNRENTTIVGVSVKKEEKERFKIACEQRNTTMNAVLSSVIRTFLEEGNATATDIPSGWEQNAPSVLRAYRTADGWQLEITDDGDNYGVWLCHDEYGSKMLLFGVGKEKHTLEDAVGLAFANVRDYYDQYKFDFM